MRLGASASALSARTGPAVKTRGTCFFAVDIIRVGQSAQH
jgi:hypothetical protein